MNVQEQIRAYFDAQPEPKRGELNELHRLILERLPECRLWFLDGRDESGKVVSNPNVGYGVQTTKYADGSAKEFYRVGISANTTGISVYILGLKDKNTLAQVVGKDLGKATITGYCIKFRTLKDINVATLAKAVTLPRED